MRERLQRSFFSRDTRLVARELLGHLLVRNIPGVGRLSGIIVETEAYCPNDLASHARNGQTKRNASMYGDAGTAYVYLIYGMHYCFNTVTESIDVPAAVLVRALEPYEGLDLMEIHHRSVDRNQLTKPTLCCGPARLCKALKIDLANNGTSITNPDSEIFLQYGSNIPDGSVLITPRKRVTGDFSARSALWRYTIRDSVYLSS